MPRNNTKFNFDGKVGLSKRQLVYEVIKKYVREHQNISLNGLQHEFNGMHDRFMVCMSEDEYNTYIKRTQTGSKRYFKEPIDLVNQKIFVCNQWGDNFPNVLKKMSELQYDFSSIIVESNDILEDEEKEEMIDNPKNIILYGPPGVGKTYSHKKLISILENGDRLNRLTDNDYDIESFNDVKDEERYQFLTFHQSYSYEDFVEGFRPNEDGKIERSDGLLKEFCSKAQKNLFDSYKPAQTLKQEKTFNQLFQDFVDDIQVKIDEINKFELTKNVYIFEIEKDAFRYKGDNWSRHDSGIRMRFDIIKDMYVQQVKSRQDIKKLELFQGLANHHATYFWELLNKFYVFEKSACSNNGIDVNNTQQIEIKNFYLIIDEINRGNISKIFGELITLLEEDKRLGEGNELTVTLPYSKEQFGIPKNLYIIGTMNTADKSIALVDIALRRRFTFIRMNPIPEKLPLKIQKINDTIIEKKGKSAEDFLIGHAYFIDNEGLMIDENHPKYSFVMKYKICPLLEEYFYGEDIDSIFGDLIKPTQISSSTEEA